MKPVRFLAAAWLALACLSVVAQARVWTDSTNQYSLEADLVSFNDESVVLKRDDHEMVAIPIEKLSDQDREYLKSAEAGKLNREADEALQTWTLRDGEKIVGCIVDYVLRDLALQRRRGRFYANDRLLSNLPEFYQQLIPKIVDHFEALPRADRRSLEEWLVNQRGQPRLFHLEGVILQIENGDEYAVPFFLFTDEDLKVLKAGWDDWLEVHRSDNYKAQEGLAYLLRSLAAARDHDQQVQREIALMKLTLQAVQVGLTSLWEVTLYPAAGQRGPPLWVVVPGRDSRQAAAAALDQNPGHVVGPIRRVAQR